MRNNNNSTIENRRKIFRAILLNPWVVIFGTSSIITIFVVFTYSKFKFSQCLTDGAELLQKGLVLEALKEFKKCEDPNWLESKFLRKEVGKMKISIAECHLIFGDKNFNEKHINLSTHYSKDALKFISKKKNPKIYGLIQKHLGRSFLSAAQLKERKKNLSMSKLAFKEALSILQPDGENLLLNIHVSIFLGDVYKFMSENKDGKSNIDTAIMIHKESWSILKNIKQNLNQPPAIDSFVNFLLCASEISLGNDYIEYSKYVDSIRYVKDGVNFLKNSIECYCGETNHAACAVIYINLINGYANLAEKTSNREYALEAVKHGEIAKDYSVSDMMDSHIQSNLGYAYLVLSRFSGARKDVINAISSCQAALKSRTILKTAYNFAWTNMILGYAFLELYKIDGKHDILDSAILVANKSLRVFTKNSVYQIQYKKCHEILYMYNHKLSKIREDKIYFDKMLYSLRESGKGLFIGPNFDRFFKNLEKEIY